MKLHPRLTPEGVLLARRAERFRPSAERDSERDGAGWVVGYGHRASAREGARVTEADAVALLAYDLSRSAGRVEPLLEREVSPALFDALNAYALRVGAEPFARSEVLRRVNAGEPVTPAEVAAAPDPAEPAPPSAVLAAAESVRDRLSQVLDAPPPPPPPRARREPWPEPSVLTPDRSGGGSEGGGDAAAGDGAPQAEPAPPPRVFPPPPPPLPAEASERAPDPRPARPHEALAQGAAASEPDVEPAEPPAAASGAPAAGLDRQEREGVEDAEGPPHRDAAPQPFPAASPTPADDGAAAAALPLAAPMISFERGGRPKLWDRLRGDPYVYMAVGACGLGLFGCALVGFLFGRPTGPGLALGVVGVVCVAPALAFFLHRRGRARG